jgi:hypothetical protein
MDPLILSLISACTALVASIAGPIVTLMVAKRQFSANVLSANRQKWIDALREALAEMISLLVAALVVKSNWRDAWQGGRAPLAKDAALLDKVQRLVLTQSKIHLLVNPTEADHQHLCAAIDGALLRLRSEQSQDSETEADIQLITQLAQKILKREWQRVKRGI